MAITAFSTVGVHGIRNMDAVGSPVPVNTGKSISAFRSTFCFHQNETRTWKKYHEKKKAIPTADLCVISFHDDFFSLSVLSMQLIEKEVKGNPFPASNTGIRI